MIDSAPRPDETVSGRKSSALGRWLRCGVTGLAGGLILLILAGVIFQALGEAADVRRYPPPGRMVDVGGYRMHIHCTGQGSPTVILDHVAVTNSAQWGLIQPQVSEATQVCAYDRAGFGWSDLGPAPRDTIRNALELHTLLAEAGIPGPYLLVGHSYGGNVARVYAMKYPEEVAGIVLVDPGIVHDRPGVPVEVNEQWKERPFIARAIPWLTRIGLMRLAALGGIPGYGDLPEEDGKAFAALQLTAKQWRTLEEIYAAFPAMSGQVLEAEKHLGGIPISVLSAELPLNDPGRQAWTEVNAALAGMGENGSHRVVPGSDHMSFALKREHAQITSETILEMVKALQDD